MGCCRYNAVFANLADRSTIRKNLRMSIDLAVVPVAGRGTRLLPLTKSQPKEMLAVGRSPVVQYLAEELHRCDIHRLIFVTGPG